MSDLKTPDESTGNTVQPLLGVEIITDGTLYYNNTISGIIILYPTWGRDYHRWDTGLRPPPRQAVRGPGLDVPGLRPA